MTAAKDQKGIPASFKSASLDQLWSCLQRCLLFEEPSSRWEKLIAQVARHANNKAKEMVQLPLAEQQQCFKTVFGTPDALLDMPSRMFNLILAMQDLRRFEQADFDVWFLSQSNDDAPLEIDSVFETIAEKILGTTPSVSQTASLWQAWNVVPYWRVLESNGPWSDDPVAEFAGIVLGKLDRMQLSLSVDSATACEAELQKMLQSAKAELPNNFLPSLLVLVEGVTETILLPKFLSLAISAWNKQNGENSNSLDIRPIFIACGGANQLLRKYLHLRDVTSLPILCVMDHDASEQSDTIRDVLRDDDRLHVWSVGEIEDTFNYEALMQSLNSYLQSLSVHELILPEELSRDARRTELLDRLWRNRGLGDFNKVGFAEFHALRLKQINDVPDEGRRLMDTLKRMAIPKHAG